MFLKGVNLGNWLVLEKWMSPALFAGTDAADEYYLPRSLSPADYAARIKLHRASYISERDFATIKALGLNAVRIPVPYFIFGDVPPFIGCSAELDKAMDWAHKFELKVLIDLHTVPGSQNGFDNGGLSGVCKWAQQPESQEFTLTVLERLSERYGSHPALWGIEILNEPLLPEPFAKIKPLERYKAVDPEMAAGSGPVPFEFLQDFYIKAYARMRAFLPEDKVIVIHDGYELTRWKGFMQAPEFKNVVLDTHQYLMFAEAEGCEQKLEAYVRYLQEELTPLFREMNKELPLICGEWSLFNSLACGHDTHGGVSFSGEEVTADDLPSDEKTYIYRTLAQEQLKVWQQGAGCFYWNYKLLLDPTHDKSWQGWDAWDLGKAAAMGWI